jgi:hypothetical protein
MDDTDEDESDPDNDAPAPRDDLSDDHPDEDRFAFLKIKRGNLKGKNKKDEPEADD